MTGAGAAGIIKCLFQTLLIQIVMEQALAHLFFQNSKIVSFTSCGKTELLTAFQPEEMQDL